MLPSRHGVINSGLAKNVLIQEFLLNFKGKSKLILSQPLDKGKGRFELTENILTFLPFIQFSLLNVV